MTKAVILTLALALSSGMAAAQQQDIDVDKVKEALTAFNCSGGEFKREPNTIEVEDAKCKTGQYDFKLHPETYVVWAITLD
jgi:hypothetical protein